jgi:hypothetical protein
MGDWQRLEIGRVGGMQQTNPLAGTTLTAGAANVKGAYATLDFAPFDTCGVMFNYSNFTTTDGLMDIALGVAGSERIALNDYPVSAGSSSARAKCFFLPLEMKSGTRVSARWQNSTASTTQTVNCFFLAAGDGGFPCYQQFYTYGAVLTTSLVTSLGNPAGANTWGAWTQIVDATKWDHPWIMPVITDLSLVTRTTGLFWAYQAGRGAAASEFQMTPPGWFASSSTAFSHNMPHGWWTPVARGQRLAMRYGSTGATNLGAGGAIIAAVA